MTAFTHAPPSPTLVRLDRSIDRRKPCCSNVAAVYICTKPPHAAGLRCIGCGAHRGWLPEAALDFIIATKPRFGAPPEPPILRDSTIGEHHMAKEYDNTNSGALFRNADKVKESDRDYSCTLNVKGEEFWLSGWIKISKKGQKFLSLALKPKDTEAAKSKASAADDLSDGIPF